MSVAPQDLWNLCYGTRSQLLQKRNASRSLCRNDFIDFNGNSPYVRIMSFLSFLKLVLTLLQYRSSLVDCGFSHKIRIFDTVNSRQKIVLSTLEKTLNFRHVIYLLILHICCVYCVHFCIRKFLVNAQKFTVDSLTLLYSYSFMSTSLNKNLVMYDLWCSVVQVNLGKKGILKVMKSICFDDHKVFLFARLVRFLDYYTFVI